MRPGGLRLLLCGTAAALLASGCVPYRAAPLAEPAATLATPDMAIVSADAQKIDRPYLTPEPIDWTQPLTPNALAIIAVLENPELKAQRTRLGVVEAQAFAARLLPDPAFQANFDKLVSGPDPYDAFGGQLAFDLNQLRTAKVARQNAEASQRQVRLDMAWAEWQTAGQARLQGVRILALEAQLLLAQAGAASAQALFEQARRAAGRGDITAADLDTRRSALTDATDKLGTATTDLAAARGELNKLLGLPPETMLRLAVPPEPAVAPPAATLVSQALARRLDLQALRAGYAVGEAEVHKAVLEQFPALSLTLAGARDTSGNSTIGPAIGFSLPLWNRNRGGIAVAKATREQLKAEYEARLFQTRAEVSAASAALVLLREQRAALITQIPASRAFAESSARAAKRGDLALATAATAEQALRDRALRLAQLDQQIAEQTIALELLSGGPSQGWTR